MLSTLVARRLVTPLILAATLVAGACSDDPTEPDDEPEVQTLTLTVWGAAPSRSTRPRERRPGTSWCRRAHRRWRRSGSAPTEVSRPSSPRPSSTWYHPGNAGKPQCGRLTARSQARWSPPGLASNATTNALVALFHKEEQHEDFLDGTTSPGGCSRTSVHRGCAITR